MVVGASEEQPPRSAIYRARPSFSSDGRHDAVVQPQYSLFRMVALRCVIVARRSGMRVGVARRPRRGRNCHSNEIDARPVHANAIATQCRDYGIRHAQCRRASPDVLLTVRVSGVPLPLSFVIE